MALRCTPNLARNSNGGGEDGLTVEQPVVKVKNHPSAAKAALILKASRHD